MMDNILSVFRNGNEILLTENEGLDGSTLIPVINDLILFNWLRTSTNNNWFEQQQQHQQQQIVWTRWNIDKRSTSQ